MIFGVGLWSSGKTSHLSHRGPAFVSLLERKSTNECSPVDIS